MGCSWDICNVWAVWFLQGSESLCPSFCSFHSVYMWWLDVNSWPLPKWRTFIWGSLMCRPRSVPLNHNVRWVATCLWASIFLRAKVKWWGGGTKNVCRHVRLWANTHTSVSAPQKLFSPLAWALASHGTWEDKSKMESIHLEIWDVGETPRQHNSATISGMLRIAPVPSWEAGVPLPPLGLDYKEENGCVQGVFQVPTWVWASVWTEGKGVTSEKAALKIWDLELLKYKP